MRSFALKRVFVAALLATALTPAEASAQDLQRQMRFTWNAGGSELAVKLDYEDPSLVDPRLDGSRIITIRVEARNVSAAPVRFDYDDIRLNFSGGAPLSPISMDEAVDEVRRLKRIPSPLSFLGGQSTAFQPRALENLLNARRLDDGDIAPGDSKTGLVFFMRPEASANDPFNGFLWLESTEMPPQMLATKGVDVYTRPGRPATLRARVQQLLSKFGQYVQGTSPAFNKSYALLVGIENYRNLSPLDWSAEDVDKVKRFLVDQGFDEIVVLSEENVAADGLKNPQKYFGAKVQADDRFLFYFSGHGQSVDVGGRIEGFLPLINEVPGGTSHSIAMRSLVAWMRALRTQHLLVILDSCFSGLASGDIQTKNANAPADPSVDLEELHRLSRGPAQYLLMAGTANQESLAAARWHGSLFTEMVVKGLRKEADLYRNKLITARELYVWLKPKVSKEAQTVNRDMTPLLMDLGPNGVSQGEFVFVQ